jgi:ketosteroid isomerase-like protein
MSRNLETVKQIYAAFGRGDIPAVLNTLANDVDVAWEAWADNSRPPRVYPG